MSGHCVRRNHVSSEKSSQISNDSEETQISNRDLNMSTDRFPRSIKRNAFPLSHFGASPTLIQPRVTPTFARIKQMSYLTPPRLSFLGRSYANASTANNNDIAGVYDIDQMKLNSQMKLMDNGQALPPSTNTFEWKDVADNPQLRKWLMGLMKAPPNSLDEDEFGTPNEGHAQMAHWNYYGDHNTEFRKTFIIGGETTRGRVAMNDPIRKIEVELLGDIFYQRRRGAVLVDADPYALITSQIFSGQFRLSYQFSKDIRIPVLTADHPTTAYSYFINTSKNLNPSCVGFEKVSAIFQFGILSDNMSFFEGKEFESDAFRDLVKSVKGARGLMVRFCLYDAIFHIQATDLAKKFDEGLYVFNPYQGWVLGSIGLWNEGELASAPPGRKLSIQVPYEYTPPPAELTDEEYAEKKRRSSTVPNYRERKTSPADDAPKTGTLGITLAKVNKSSSIVTLDCISTFPEANIHRRDKFDLGPMNLVLLYGTPLQPGELPPNSVTIGAIPNDKATYEIGGGVVDISYANSTDLETINANIEKGQLAIFRAGTNAYQFQLIESPAFVAQTDQRVVYFDAKVGSGKSAIPGTSQIRVQLSRRDARVNQPTLMNLEYWMCQKDYINPDKPQVPVTDPYFSVENAKRIKPTCYKLPYTNLSQPVEVITDQIEVTGGEITLKLTALRPGVSMIRFVDPTVPKVVPAFAWDNVDFATVRILPFDDYSEVPDHEINNWDYIYRNVFGFYSVLYPIMSKVIPWGPDGAPKDPATVRQFASELLAFTDPNIWNTTIYMPITRDMSAGKRELLRRWCNLQQ